MSRAPAVGRWGRQRIIPVIQYPRCALPHPVPVQITTPRTGRGVVGGFEFASVRVDADDQIPPARPPCHPVEVEVGDEVVGRALTGRLRAERIGDEREAGRAGRGAGRAVDLGEGEADGSRGEAGAEGAGEVGRGVVDGLCHTRIVREEPMYVKYPNDKGAEINYSTEAIVSWRL